MKSRSFANMLLTALFFAGLTSCYAQGPITAKVPFDFVAGEKTLPAGTYVFRDALPNNQTELALTDGRGHGALASASTNDLSEAGNKLVFRHYGESYFLGDIYSPAGRLHFAPGRAESKLAQTASAQQVTVVVGD